ncbi:MAG: phytanoyl-CoA dioxygenase family protein [Armatimonadetes bacterium]|nr:phytanoyl-CoA dioxygenase family protein [Armatimonadota bacterium]
MKDFQDSGDLIQDPQALRDRAGRDGYLFFRRLIEPKRLRDLRRQILDLCAEAGWLAPGSDPLEGIVAPGRKLVEPEPEFMAVYDRIQRLEAFHALAHEPALVAMYDRLFGEPTLVHPRNIARIIFPANEEFTTPAHQDYIHIRGTPDTWTAWIPLGDCPEELGSLAILSGSHQAGIYETHPAKGAGGRGIDTAPLPFEWRTGDFQAGDVLVFHSHAVHKAVPNRSRDRLRLSVDYRYQPISGPVTRGSLLPHYARHAWPEIYQGWRSTELQGYWERLPLNIIEE